MPALSVNIDHVATIRQARYRGGREYGEPDPVRAAHEAELGGADGITVHLREDRRHITDRDVELLRPLVRVRFNLEMAATREMVGIATRLKPHSAMLVPEGRNEVTTEGGLDVAGGLKRLKEVVKRLRGAGCVVSAFIDAEERQVEAAAKAGFDICEVHTGPYAAAFLKEGGDLMKDRLFKELERVVMAGNLIVDAGMRFNAGHALNYNNVHPIAALPSVGELHIGHAIISRAIYVGIRAAVTDMKDVLHHAANEAALGHGCDHECGDGCGHDGSH
jgi:pyridoxine 5-phosphate synthase